MFEVNVDKMKVLAYNSNIKETNTMSNLSNIKLNNWWNVWDKNHPYKFVVLQIVYKKIFIGTCMSD